MSAQSRITQEMQESFKETPESSEKNEKKEKNKKEPVTCGICYNELSTKNCVVTPCNHSFCNSCFFTWLDKKETCALCRRTLLNDDVVRERAENLQEVQADLVVNYRYLKRIRKEIKFKEEENKFQNAKAISLQGRQIRLRMMLERLRKECHEVIPENLKSLNKSLKLLTNYKESCNEISRPKQIPITRSSNKRSLSPNHEEEYNESNESKTESNLQEEKSSEDENQFPDVLNMLGDIQEMIEADRIIYHTQRRAHRQRRIAEMTTEMMRGVGTADEAVDEAADEATDETADEAAYETEEVDNEEVDIAEATTDIVNEEDGYDSMPELLPDSEEEKQPDESSRNVSQSPFIFGSTSNAPITFNFGEIISSTPLAFEEYTGISNPFDFQTIIPSPSSIVNTEVISTPVTTLFPSEEVSSNHDNNSTDYTSSTESEVEIID
jgi:hypothetical protein